MKFSLKKKVFLVVVLVAAMLTAASILVSYRIYAETMVEHYQQLAMNLARTAARVVDVEDVQTLTDRVMQGYRAQCEGSSAPDFDSFSEEDWENYYSAFDGVSDSPEYAELFKTLNMLKNENDVLWMYICYMDAETGKAVYIIDAAEPGEANLSGYCDPIVEGNSALMQQGIYDFPAYTTNYEEYGWLCSASAAITDEDGQVIANAYVDISMNDVMRDRQHFLVHLGKIVLVVAVALVILLAVAVNRGIISPINRLAKATDQFISEKQEGADSSAISKLSIRTGDEIENLCYSIKHMEQEINDYIVNLTNVTAERERIGAELDVAKNIQSSMLPCIFPPFPQWQEFDIFATMSPAKEVGGDFYDFFLVDDDHLALVIADVSGKGVPAAMFMVIAKTLLKNSAQTGLSPKVVLEKVNNQLCENNDAEMFVTVWLGILEISTGRMVCANAGHEFPILRRADGRFELFKDRHGFVLAGMQDAKYREYEIILGDGDTLFVYTDGVTEATDLHNQLYGTNRLLEALNQCGAENCADLLRGVRADIDRFVGQAPQFDDITMLAIHLRDSKGEHMQKIHLKPDLESLERATAFFEEILEQNNAPTRIISQINVVVDEIFSNIVHYSGSTSVTLGCEVMERRILLRFSDNGRPYDPTKKPDPDVTLPLEEREVGGMGIFMVKKIMDRVCYDYADGFNVLTMEKNW
ncbi:MAG TPA: SpoIIE family protein phosphatase [Candidatus Pullichristensenella excrementigallinarum]|uniref:SpoIIE family protein phosphatase n=1 Tax=Candidatus Pullichristensenella excrementigallinarum TaxID=2840907 RepID=A0A9D1IC71_9FIRM|nr:SpoIIE family protein phosphatase [Candidatus Pullichristensenella excrementigallinarum]